MPAHFLTEPFSTAAIASLRRWKVVVLSVPVALLLTACPVRETATQPPKNTRPPRSDSQLILNNATLEQADINGQTLWKIQVESAVYSADKKRANLTKVRGNLFQGKTIVLQISADNGEIERNGENVTLKNNVLAIDPRNKAALRSNAVEWHPKEALLKVSQPLKGTHAKVVVVAQQGQYSTRTQQLELSGNIIATAQNPKLQLKTDRALWKIPQQTVIGDRPLTLTRFEGNTITDKLSAGRVEVLLAKKIANVQQNIEFKAVEPPLQIAAAAATWDYKNRLVTSDKPIEIVHYRDDIVVTGNSARVDLVSRIAQLNGGVRGVNRRNPAQLYAQTLTWNVGPQTVEAQGNVIYEQANPQFNLTGEKALGSLVAKNITIQGNPKERVVTEILTNPIR